MAQRRIARLGMERHRHRSDGLVVRRVPAPRRRAACAPAGTTHPSPTARSGASASTFDGPPALTPHRCSSMRWAPQSGSRSSRTSRTCPTRWPGSHAVAELARRTVSAGRITPVIVDEGPFTVARWRPVTTPSIESTIDALAHCMPPICTAGSSVNAATIYGQLVDGIARSFLHQYGWKADLGRQRTPVGPGAARHLRRTGQTRPRRTWRHRRVRHRPPTASAMNSTVTVDGSPANRWSSPASASLISDDAARSVDRAPRTRRRSRQRPLVHRQRRLGRERHGTRGGQGRPAPRPAAPSSSVRPSNRSRRSRASPTSLCSTSRPRSNSNSTSPRTSSTSPLPSSSAWASN